MTAATEDEIRSLFGQWIDLQLQRAALPDECWDPGQDTALKALDDRADAIERRIYASSARGPVGMAIKGFLVARYFRIDDAESGSLGQFSKDDYFEDGSLIWPNLALRSLAEDALRFLPELAPLVAGVVDAPTGPAKRRKR